MKKYNFVQSFIILALLISIILPFSASASPAMKAGIKPNSFFCFFDTTFEKIDLFFTFNKENKIEKSLAFARERLEEVKEMANENNSEAVDEAMRNYEEKVFIATTEANEIEDKEKAEHSLSIITEVVSNHQAILAEVLEKVPEQAKEAIIKAIEVSKKGQERAEKRVKELKEENEKLKKEIEELKDEDENSENEKEIENEEIEKLRKEVEELKQNQSQIKVIEKVIEKPVYVEIKNEKETTSTSDKTSEFKEALISLINNNIKSFQPFNKSIDDFVNVFGSRVSMINEFILDNNRMFGSSSEQSVREIGILWNEEYQADIDQS